MQFGPWDVQIVSGGTFRLDGGAMFGTVPKVVWNKVYPADEDNMILMATNCLLIRGEVDGKRHTILVDNGKTLCWMFLQRVYWLFLILVMSLRKFRQQEKNH